MQVSGLQDVLTDAGLTPAEAQKESAFCVKRNQLTQKPHNSDIKINLIYVKS